MIPRLRTLFFLVILLSLLLSACGAGQVFGPTITPSATITLTPTVTASTTPTITPTSTNTPLPSPTPDRLLDLKMPSVSLLVDDFPNDPVAFKMTSAFFLYINKLPVRRELIRQHSVGFKREYPYKGNSFKVEDYFDLNIFLFNSVDNAKAYFNGETAVFRPDQIRMVEPTGDQSFGFYIDTYLVRYNGMIWRYKEAVGLMIYHGSLPANGEDIFRLADIVQARLEKALK